MWLRISKELKLVNLEVLFTLTDLLLNSTKMVISLLSTVHSTIILQVTMVLVSTCAYTITTMETQLKLLEITSARTHSSETSPTGLMVLDLPKIVVALR